MKFYFKADGKGTIIKTIRFPIELVDKIEEVLIETNSSFSSFVTQACEFAIKNMEFKKD